MRVLIQFPVRTLFLADRFFHLFTVSSRDAESALWSLFLHKDNNPTKRLYSHDHNV